MKIFRGKWIKGVAADRPVSVAARQAVQLRLASVNQLLTLAVDGNHDQVESLHRLRVSTRRAIAAMRCYRETLPRRRARWVKKHLRRIRKRSNDARDCDVLLARLRHFPPPMPNTDWTTLVKQIKAFRRQAYVPVAKTCEHLLQSGFERRGAQLVKRIRWRSVESCEPRFAEAARQKMRLVVGPFFEAAAGDLSRIEALHRFRILGKKLRYAMEIFVAAFEPPFRQELYPMVAEVQQKLGQVNDHAWAISRLQRWRDDWPQPQLEAPLAQLLEAEEAALDESGQRFAQWWTTQRAAELKRRFEGFLGPWDAGCVDEGIPGAGETAPWLAEG